MGFSANQSTSGNPTSNAILERICRVIGNLVRTYNIKETYVDKDDPWSGILSAALLVICSTENRLKVYSPVQLLSGRYMVLPIKNMVYW